MDLRREIHNTEGFANLELLAKQVVEGYISGRHKSPFHGFSAEFAEHRLYNKGESSRHIDWKLYARTEKLYTRRYEEETNLRCHLIIDNSGSMHFPEMKRQDMDSLNKIGFSALAAACLIQVLSKQRDAVGLSVYSDSYEFYAPEKGSERHRQMLLHTLEEVVTTRKEAKKTDTISYLHQIAEKLKRRSLVFLFSDMFQSDVEEKRLFEALRHLKYNRHEVVLFHVMDRERELQFGFDNQPRRFVDVETGEKIDLYADSIREGYHKIVREYFDSLKLQCARYGIKYVEADIGHKFQKIMTTYFIERQKFG